jgi:hypothetical protein
LGLTQEKEGNIDIAPELADLLRNYIEINEPKNTIEGKVIE